MEQPSPAERDAADGRPIAQRPELGPETSRCQFIDDRADRTSFEVAVHDVADLRRLCFVYDQFAIDHVITEWDRTSHPHAFALRGSNLVSDTLSSNFALELGERQ